MDTPRGIRFRVSKVLLIPEVLQLVIPETSTQYQNCKCQPQGPDFRKRSWLSTEGVSVDNARVDALTF